LLCLGVLCASERRAAAQDDTVPEMQTHGLFGSGSSNVSSNKLGVTAVVSEGFDSAVPPELQPRLNQSGPQSGGYSSIFLTAANYERRRRRIDVFANLVTSTRYYGGLGEFSTASSTGAVGITLRLSSRSTATLNETAAYSPSYLYRLFPSITPPAVGDALPAGPDYRAVETPSFSNATTFGYTYGSDRAVRVSFEAAHERADFETVLDQDNLDIVSGRGRISHGVGRTGLVSVEFEHRQGDFGFGATTTERRIKVGGEYAPALSISRRLHLRFNVAPSRLDVPETATKVSTTGRLYRFEADTAVKYPFLYNWSIGGAYRRGVEYLGAITHPVFSDAVRLDVSGLVARRLDLSGSVAYLTGRSLLVAEDQRLDSSMWRGRVRYAMGRNVAIYGEYLHYHYNFSHQAALIPGVSPRFDQHGIRVGAMLWAQPIRR
jgi:hypothetical protein